MKIFTKGNTDGAHPRGALVQGNNGNFYGTTSAYGNDDPNFGRHGTVFQITSMGGFTTLHRFTYSSGPDGAEPNSGLIQASDGNFYGTTALGGNGGAGTVFKLTIPAPPMITSATTATASVGKAFTYQITATNSPTSYSTSSTPPGLSFSTSTGKFTGTTTKAGTYKPLLSAINSAGKGSVNLNLVVNPAAPAITSPLTADAQVGVAFSYQIAATNSPTKYAISSMPPGLTFNTATGKLSGTPTKAGSYRPLVAATNAGGTGSANVALTINAPKPVITSDLNPPARQGSAFVYQIFATNNPTSYATSSIPPGLSFSTSTGKFTGTPTKAGTYKPLVSATNSGGTASVNLNLVVKPPS